MTGTCLCGRVHVTIVRRPDFIHDCNCTLCRKTGGAWGYFATAEVSASGDTLPVQRHDKPEPAAEVHSCAHCLTTTHFTMAKAFTDRHGPVDMAGVNMRLFDPAELAGVEVRFPDGRNWPGQGDFGYRRAPLTIGPDAAW